MVSNIKGMLNRVFIPAYQGEMYIITNQEIGLIGSDKQFGFHEHIRSADGKPFAVSKDDFYISPCIKPIKDNSPLIIRIIKFVFKKIFYFLMANELVLPEKLPSSLFKGAKENDRVRFFYDDHPVELTLKQQNHGKENFETFFSSITKLSKGTYEYRQDIPEDALILKTSTCWRRLSSEAVFKTFPDQIKPVTKEELDAFNSAIASSTPFMRPITSVQTPQIQRSVSFKALIDGPFVTVLGCTKIDFPEGTINGSTIINGEKGQNVPIQNQVAYFKLDAPIDPPDLQLRLVEGGFELYKA